jgi:hypothetical protein
MMSDEDRDMEATSDILDRSLFVDQRVFHSGIGSERTGGGGLGRSDRVRKAPIAIFCALALSESLDTSALLLFACANPTWV